MLPLVFLLRGRTALVVGAGPVGVRKAAAVLDAGGRVRLVDPDPAAGVSHPSVSRVIEPYSPAHLAGAALAFACAPPAVNAAVAADATARGVWVCDASDPARGDFALPSVVRRGDLTVAVSTGGAAPALARRIAGRLSDEFDAAYAGWVRVLGEVRAVVLATVPDPADRRRLFERFAAPHWLERTRAAGPDATKAEMLGEVRAEVRADR
jgi:precorrin-2 dehydrogenase/sirohydrochlorin ferrochelatase